MLDSYSRVAQSGLTGQHYADGFASVGSDLEISSEDERARI
jgi:hypothetical protein